MKPGRERAAGQHKRPSPWLGSGFTWIQATIVTQFCLNDWPSPWQRPSRTFTGPMGLMHAPIFTNYVFSCANAPQASWTFWRKEVLFLGCSGIKTNKNNPKTPTYVFGLWGKAPSLLTKVSATGLKASFQHCLGRRCWALPTGVVAWLQSTKTCTSNSPYVKISKYLLAVTAKTTEDDSALKAQNPSSNPGTAQVVGFSIAAALFQWKYKIPLNWIGQLKSKEI